MTQDTTQPAATGDERRRSRWLEVTSDMWMLCAHYCTTADVETVKRAAAEEWHENMGYECTPEDFIVTEMYSGEADQP